MSSASSLGEKGSKTGKNWEGNLLLSDPSCITAHLIDEDLLVNSWNNLRDGSEMIQEIWVYKCPLSPSQFTQRVFHHQFVVFKTRKWWWSIEKNDKRIQLRRSKSLSCLRDYREELKENQLPVRKQVKRPTPIKKLSNDKGQKSVKDVIEFLYRKNELNKEYHWIDDNCQDFAKRIFDEFAQTKSHTSTLARNTPVIVGFLLLLAIAVTIASNNRKKPTI